MTHAEMPPRGHIPAYGVRNLAEGREVEIYPTALPHEPFNTVEYLSVQESQARESRAREEGEKVGLGMALQLINEEAQGDLDFGVFLISQMLKGSSPEAKERLAKTIAEQLERAAASRSGEGEAPDPDWERE